MKHIKRFIALLMACLMFGSTLAFAADAAEDLLVGEPNFDDALSEEQYAFYYDDAQYEREFDTQSVNVYLKEGVKNTPDEYRFDYSVGSGIYTGGIPITVKTDDTGTQRILVRKTVAGTRESVLAEIEQLKNNPYVYYAEPNYKLRPWMGGSTTPVETEYDIGDPNYNDLIDEWNYLRLYSGYKPEFSIKAGELTIVLKEGTDVSGCFNEIFTGLDVESVSFELRKTMSLFDNVGEKRNVERQYASVKLTDESDQHVIDVCISLKDHPLVYSASPSYIIPVCGGGTDPGIVDNDEFDPETDVAPLGDVDGNGTVGNTDLILVARYVVDLTALSEDQLWAADMSEDGTVNNIDIIQLAREMVGIGQNGESRFRNEIEKRITLIFRKNHRISIRNMTYYGKYSGCEVAVINVWGGAAVIVHTVAAGYDFTFGGTDSGMFVFKGYECLSIDKAYEAGWITEEDVAQIHSDYVGAVFKPSGQRMNEIGAAYKKYTNTAIYNMNYYGVYSDCDIAAIQSDGVFTAAEYHIQAAGYDFRFASGGYGLYAFKGNDCLRLDKAFDAGWLTDEDIAAIWVKGGKAKDYHKLITDGYGNAIVDEYYPSRWF